MGPELKTKNKDLEIKHQIKNAIYDYWEEIKNVRAYLYYMTQSPKPLDSLVLDDAMKDIDDMNGDQGVFHNFTKKGGYLKFIPCNASKIMSMYESYSRYEREATFDVDESIVLPEIEGIKKSFMTYIYFKEFLNIILESDNRKYIDESIFEENVRSFQGENEVNSKILNTLKGGGAE